MDIEARLRSLESRHRKTLSSTIAAKAHYLALLDEPGSTPAAIKRARSRWETLDIRKREIAARMGEVEDLEQHLHADRACRLIAARPWGQAPGRRVQPKQTVANRGSVGFTRRTRFSAPN